MNWQQKHKILSDLGPVTWVLNRKIQERMTYNHETKLVDKPYTFESYAFHARIPLLVKTVGDTLEDFVALPVEGIGYTAGAAINNLFQKLTRMKKRTKRTTTYLVRDSETDSGIGYIYDPHKLRFFPYVETELCPDKGTRARKPRKRATAQDVYARIAQITGDESKEERPAKISYSDAVRRKMDTTDPDLAEKCLPPTGYEWSDFRRPKTGDIYISVSSSVATWKRGEMKLSSKKRHGGRRHILRKKV